MSWKNIFKNPITQIVGSAVLGPLAGELVGEGASALDLDIPEWALSGAGGALSGGALGLLGGNAGRGALIGGATGMLSPIVRNAFGGNHDTVLGRGFGSFGESADRVSPADIRLPDVQNYPAPQEAADPAKASWLSRNKLPLGIGALMLMAQSQQSQPEMSSGQTTYKPPEGWDTPLDQYESNNEMQDLSDVDWYTYGTRERPVAEGEGIFFKSPQRVKKMSHGGALSGGVVTGDSGYVGTREPGGTGRSDGVLAYLGGGPAKVSNKEYVMDAETVALLGDGDPDAGADELDKMRVNVRKHKGAALAKGKFSPNAKGALSYLPKRKK